MDSEGDFPEDKPAILFAAVILFLAPTAVTVFAANKTIIICM